MKETQEHINLLLFMSAVLRERKSGIGLTSMQRINCDRGIIALERAVEALQVQIYA